MNKVIIVDGEQMDWLVNGVEVELEANKQHRKMDIAPDERDMMERVAHDLGKLLVLLRSATDC